MEVRGQECPGCGPWCPEAGLSQGPRVPTRAPCLVPCPGLTVLRLPPGALAAGALQVDDVLDAVALMPPRRPRVTDETFLRVLGTQHPIPCHPHASLPRPVPPTHTHHCLAQCACTCTQPTCKLHPCPGSTTAGPILISVRRTHGHTARCSQVRSTEVRQGSHKCGNCAGPLRTRQCGPGSGRVIPAGG